MSPKKSVTNPILKTDIPTTITLGDQTITLNRLNVAEGIELCLLVVPYMSGIIEALQELSKPSAPEAQARILRGLVRESKQFPGDLMRMIGVFSGRRPKWIAKNATGAEAIEALGVIIIQPEFGEVLKMGSRLGLVKLTGREDQDG